MKNTKTPTATPIAMLPLNKKYYIAAYDISMQYEKDVCMNDLFVKKVRTGRVINLLGNAYPNPYLDYQATIAITRVKNENTGCAFVLDFENCGEVLPIIEYHSNVYRLATDWYEVESHFIDAQEVSLYKTLDAAWEEADMNIYTEGYKHHSPEMFFLQNIIVKKTQDIYDQKNLKYLLQEYVKVAKGSIEVLSYDVSEEETEEEKDQATKKEAYLFKQIVSKELMEYLYQKITDLLMQNGKMLETVEKDTLFQMITEEEPLKQFEEVFYAALSNK